MKKTNTRWIIAILMWAAITISYLDRTVMSAAAPDIMKDFHIDPTTSSGVTQHFRSLLVGLQIKLVKKLVWLLALFGGLLQQFLLLLQNPLLV